MRKPNTGLGLTIFRKRIKSKRFIIWATDSNGQIHTDNAGGENKNIGHWAFPDHSKKQTELNVLNIAKDMTYVRPIHISHH